MFSCELCEIFKNTSFREHLWTTASDKIQIYYFIDPAFFVGVPKLKKNTLKLQDTEDKKKFNLCKLNVKTCEFKQSFYISPQIDSTKDNRSRGMKTIEINVRAVYSFRSIRVGHTALT